MDSPKIPAEIAEAFKNHPGMEHRHLAQDPKTGDWRDVGDGGAGMAAIQADIKRLNWEGLAQNAFWGLLAGAVTTIFMSPDHSIKLGVQVGLILTTCATVLTWMRGDGYTLISPKR